MLRILSTIIFKVSGWKLEGDIPEGIDKCVIIVAPHTSNIDYFFGLHAAYKLRLPIRFLIKQEWLNMFFVGKLIKGTGGVGVDRSGKKNMVAAMADFLRRADRVALVFPPEGTRKLNARWKTGFYYVALKAKVPIVFASLDYGEKRVTVGPSFMPTGDFARDMSVVREAYRHVTARYPHKFSLPYYDAAPGKVVNE